MHISNNGLCRGLWVWQSLTLKGYGLDFLSEKHSSQYVGNVSIYSVGKDMVYQIWQNNKIECFTGISRKCLTREIFAKTNCHHLSWLFTFQSCAKHMASLRGKATRELPVKTPLIFNLSWVFTFSLTHNPYNKIQQKI